MADFRSHPGFNPRTPAAPSAPLCEECGEPINRDCDCQCERFEIVGPANAVDLLRRVRDELDRTCCILRSEPLASEIREFLAGVSS